MVNEEVILIKEHWSIEAEGVLKEAFCGDDEFIKNEVEAGVSELFRVKGEGKGFIVTRIDFETELVLVAAAGSGGYWVLEKLKNLAKENGLKSMRLHSRRLGMEKYLKNTGFQLHEKVFKVEF